MSSLICATVRHSMLLIKEGNIVSLTGRRFRRHEKWDLLLWCDSSRPDNPLTCDTLRCKIRLPLCRETTRRRWTLATQRSSASSSSSLDWHIELASWFIHPLDLGFGLLLPLCHCATVLKRLMTRPKCRTGPDDPLSEHRLPLVM